MVHVVTRGRRRSSVAKILAVAASFAAAAAGQVAVTVTRTVGTGTSVAANTLVVDSASTGAVVTAAAGQCGGVAMNAASAGASVPVAQYGAVKVYAYSSPTPTVGDLVLCPTSSTTAGYGVDAGTALSSGVTLGTPIVGRILAAGTPATVQLFGPGVFGSSVTASTPLTYTSGTVALPPANSAANGYLASSDWNNFETAFNNYLYPVKNGFSQAGSYSYSPVVDAYTYKMSINPSTTYIPTVSNSSYGAWWIDRGGFGTSGYGITTVAPYDFELLRLSAVTQASVRENTFEIFDFTTQGLGSVPGSFFNEAGVDSYGSTPPPLITMYGINTHTSGCNGTKCGAGQTDFDIRQIGIESDVEERSGYSTPSHMGLKLSPASIGVYSVCVACNNSGQTSSGFFPNIGFLAGANTAAGASGNSPWGVAFESGAGGALTGMILNATANAASTDAQQIEQCAINSAGTPVCSFLSTTHLSAFTVASPGVTTVTNAVGLQANHYGGLASAPAPVPAAGGAITTTPTLTGNDFQGSISIPSTKVSFATSNNLVVVTFGTSYGSAPVCLVSENSNPIIGVGHLAPAAGSLTITASIANPTASAYNIDYFCSGN